MIPASSFDISANLNFQSEDGTIQFVTTEEDLHEVRFSDWNIFFKVLLKYGVRLKKFRFLDFIGPTDILVDYQSIIRIRNGKVRVASLLDGLKILIKLMKFWVIPDASN